MSYKPVYQRHSMPVESFLEKFAPAYPYREGVEPNWEQSFAFLSENPADKELVERLREELAAKGSFDNPVLVSYDEEDEHYWYVSDGMHRVAAWVLNGNKFIEFRDNEKEYTCLVDFCYETEFRIAHPNGERLTEEEEEELVDDLISSLSQPMPDGRWAGLCLVSGSEGTMCLTWNSNLPQPGFEEFLSDMVASRTKALGYDLSYLATQMLSEFEDED